MALYHKHRPQKFSEIWGQEYIVQTITNQIKNNKLAHAYLFSGPRGVGKTTTARLLAKAANCRNRRDGECEPCNTCDSCSEISESRSIDVMELDAASHTGVDNVREQVIENAQTQPTKSKYKIFIVDEVHMLSTSAFNALLKTLEEPPEFVIFIMATTELGKLPETIISRCQRFDFKRLPAETIKKQIKKISVAENVEIESAVIDRIVYKSDGCDRDAVSLLDQLISSGEKKITADTASLFLPIASLEGVFTLVKDLLSFDVNATLADLMSILEKGSHPLELSEEIISFLRMILISHYDSKSGGAFDLSDEIKKGILSLKSEIRPEKIMQLIDIFLKRRAQIKMSPVPQLPLELAIIEYCTNQVDDDRENKAQQIAKASEPAYRATAPESQSAPPKKNIIEKVKNFVSTDPVCNKEDAERALAECAKMIGAVAPTMISVLKFVSVTNVRGNTIHLTVPFKFYKDKLESGAYNQKLCDTLSQILNTTVNIEIISADRGSADKDIENLAAAFGGEVV